VPGSSRRGAKIRNHDRAKRPIEVAIVLIALILLSPVMVVIALCVAFFLGRPVFFRGERVGKDERVFWQLKFRTMSDARDEHGELLPDEVRLGRFGRFLRKTSLDELPQLFNILAGHMSIIGPRPLFVLYLERYNETQRRRHDVRPGLTGLAQASGRNAVSWDDRFALDVQYVDHASFRMDAQILWKSVWLVLRAKGISSADHAVAIHQFQGSGARALSLVQPDDAAQSDDAKSA
jgi:undecaprenyl phosphate N,N'-diacetylbacillosamine 1-phosphate transferase